MAIVYARQSIVSIVLYDIYCDVFSYAIIVWKSIGSPDEGLTVQNASSPATSSTSSCDLLMPASL